MNKQKKKRVCKFCDGPVGKGFQICFNCRLEREILSRRKCKVCGGDVKRYQQFCDDCRLSKKLGTGSV